MQPYKGGHRTNLRAQLLLAGEREQQRLCQARICAVTSSLPQGQDRQQQPPGGSRVSRLSRKSEAGIKNSIFPFSGASTPAQGRERSREAPTLPEGLAAAKDALSAVTVLGSARCRGRAARTCRVLQPWMHVQSPLCTHPVENQRRQNTRGDALEPSGLV